MAGPGLEAERDTGQLLVVLHQRHPLLNRSIQFMLRYVGYSLRRRQPANLGFASLLRMASQRDATWIGVWRQAFFPGVLIVAYQIGFTRTSSACRRMADKASSI